MCLHQVKESLWNICFWCDRVSVLFGKGKKYVHFPQIAVPASWLHLLQ